MSKKKTHDEYVKELSIKNPTMEVVGDYIDAHTKILHYCTIHNKDWMIAPMNALNGHGCDVCHVEKSSKLRIVPYEQYINELQLKHPRIKIVGEYNGKSTKALHYCEKHDIYWNAKPIDVLKSHGCKLCTEEYVKTIRCKSHEDYASELAIKNPNLEIVGKYIDSHTPIAHRCLTHNVIWNISPDSALHGSGCNKCGKDKIKNKLLKTHEWYVEKLAIMNPDVEVVEQYIDMKTPIKHLCKIDNVYWDVSPSNVLRGSHCHECWKRQIGESNKKTHDQYVSDLKQIHCGIFPIETYVNATTAIWHECSKCGARWIVIPNNLLHGRGCPGCNQSYGEQHIATWLNDNNLKYTIQHKFLDCKYKKPLPFDFYLQEYNLCIEYDGGQHFVPVDFSGKGKDYARKQLKIIQLRDDIKTKYCQTHGIRLLRIAYSQNINEELTKFFSFECINKTG